MDSIWFNKTFSLSGMRLRRATDAPVNIHLPSGEGEIVLWIQPIKQPPQLCCDALVNRRVKPAVAEMFKSLADGFLPRDSSSTILLPYSLSHDAVIGADGRIPEKWIVPLEILPTKFQALSREVSKQLSDGARNFITTLRWSHGAAGKQNPFGHGAFEWSCDKNHWRHMPASVRVRLLDSKRGIDTSSEAIERVKDLLAATESEPLAHELIREARDIANANPRSALLISISALETGLKAYIGALVPNSHIILEKIQSPPALTLTQDVIPKLHTELKKPTGCFPFSTEDKEFLQKWITQRNQIAHGLKGSINNIEELLKLIDLVEKVLYTLDVLRGHEWAKPFAVSTT